MRPAAAAAAFEIRPIDRLEFGAGLVIATIVDIGRRVGVARAAEVLRHPRMPGPGGGPAVVLEHDIAGRHAERVVERLALLDGLRRDHAVRTAGEEIDLGAGEVGERVDPAFGGKLS